MTDGDYARGPGRQRSRGPVLDVYADTDALTRPCPDCGVKVEQFCIWPDTGIERKTPCKGRQSEPLKDEG